MDVVNFYVLAIFFQYIRIILVFFQNEEIFIHFDELDRITHA